MSDKFPLQGFFAEGNKIAVIGSSIYLPNEATDVDFLLFTTDGENPFEQNPSSNEEMIRYLSMKGFKQKLHYLSKEDKKPYNIELLPIEDTRLDCCLLMGTIFGTEEGQVKINIDEFLTQHYSQVFGKDYLIFAWKRFAKYVWDKHDKEQLMRRDKDYMMIMQATEKITHLPEIGELVDCIIKKSIKEYENIESDYKLNRIKEKKYHDDMIIGTITFIREVKTLFENFEAKKR